MALQTSGKISLLDIRTELKKDGKISLNDSDVRKLAEKEYGEIKLSDFYGKSSVISTSFVYEIEVTISIVKTYHVGYDEKNKGCKIVSIKRIEGNTYKNILKEIHTNIGTNEITLFLSGIGLDHSRDCTIMMYAKGNDEPDEDFVEILNGDSYSEKFDHSFIMRNPKLTDLLMRLKYQKKNLVLNFDVMFE